MAKIKPKDASSVVDIEKTISGYDKIRAQIKLLSSKKDELSAIIKKYAQSNAQKDNKGSYFLKSADESLIFGAVAKKSIKLDPDKSKELFKSKGLWDDVIDTIEVINEDKVALCVADKSLTQEEVESVCNIKTTYQVLVKEYVPEEEEMPVIETQSSEKGKKKPVLKSKRK